MPVAEHILQTLLLSKAQDVERAVAVMLDADAKQRAVKAQHPESYDESFHAAGIAQHIQGIYTQIEGLIKQAIEQTDGKLPKSETWHQDLIRLAATSTDDREPLVDAAGARSLKEVLGFRHMARSNYAGELDPPRVFEHIANTVAAAGAAVSGVRRMFDPSGVPPDHASERKG